MAEDKSTTAEFNVVLNDGMSAAAQTAAQALEALKGEISADTKALADMQKAMRNLKAATGQDVAKPMAELEAKMTALRGKIGATQGKYVELGGTFSGLKAKTKTATTEVKVASTGLQAFAERMKALSTEASGLPGPLGSMAGGLSKVAGTMSTATLAAVALTAAFVAVVAAGVAVTKMLFDQALASGDAARSELLHFEALTKMRNLLGIAPGKAKDMQDAVDAVSSSVSISREKVSGYAEQLYKAGLRGANLSAALEGTSIKASALGDAAGGAFAGWAGSLALAGGSVKRLSEDVKNRFGGIVQKQMASLEVQTLKQKENWASLFRGINVDPFLNAMKRLRDIFSVNTAAGRALKQLFTTFLQPLFDAAEGGAVFMRRFFKQMIIGVQELVIAYLLVRNWFRKAFGSEQYKSLSDLFLKLQIGKVFVYLIAAAFAVLAFNVLAAAAPFLIMAAVVYFAFQKISELYDLWKIIDWGELGQNIIDGLIGGLNAAAGAVAQVFEDIAGGAVKAFKDALGIASPSKVFAEIGTEIPAGAAKGIKQGSPEAQSAAQGMVDASTIKLGSEVQGTSKDKPLEQGGARAAAGAVTVSIGELHVHAESGEPRALALAFRREVESVLEGVALQLGAQPLGAAP